MSTSQKKLPLPKFSALIETPLGLLMAISDEVALHRLEFMSGKETSKRAPPIDQIEEELTLYFQKKLKVFQTPYHFIEGTPFQQKVWKALSQIPFGETRSYAELAKAIGHPNAYRAVGNANGKNPLSIIVPCHRVIHRGRTLGGYAGGVEKKRGLLKHEGTNFP